MRVQSGVVAGRFWNAKAAQHLLKEQRHEGLEYMGARVTRVAGRTAGGFRLGATGLHELPDALADSTFNFSEKGILALALALLIIAGEIDLSIAAILALCSLAMGYAMKAGAGPVGMTLAALLTGAVAGAVNGVLVTGYKLPSIVVTIGTLSLYRGLALVALGDQAISGYPEVFSTLGNSYVGEIIGVRWLIIPIEFASSCGLCAGCRRDPASYGRGTQALRHWRQSCRRTFHGIEVDRYRLALFVFPV